MTEPAGPAPTPRPDPASDLRQRLRTVLRRSPQLGPPWVPAAHDVNRTDAVWIVVVATMLVPAALFFGWRAALQVGLTALTATAAHTLIETLLRSLRLQRARLISPHAFWLGLLLGLSLPVILNPLVPVVAGMLLGVVIHLVGRSHTIRAHPVAVVLMLIYLLPWAAPGLGRQATIQTVDAVLAKSHIFMGDVTMAGPDPVRQPWWVAEVEPRDRALRRTPPIEVLLEHRHAILDDVNHLRFLLSSGQLPRLEAVILGMVPGPVGATSPLLIILLGLALIHLRLSSWRIVLTAGAVGLATLLLTPLPNVDGPPIVAAVLWDIGPAAGITFLAYFFLASPLPLVYCIYASLSSPMARAGRWVFGALLGVTTTALLLWTNDPAAPFVALVGVGILARPLDALHRSPFVHG